MSDIETNDTASAEKAYAEATTAVHAAMNEEQPGDPAAETKPAAPAKFVAKMKAAPARRAVAKKPARAKAVRKPAAPRKAPSQAAAKTKTATKTVTTPKEKIMPKTAKTAKISKGIQEAVTEAQAKAKVAVEKGTALLGEAGEFTKGNVEAVVESGKVLATGLQSMGNEFVAEGRSAFETVTGDVKQIAAVKSPTELLKVQSEITRKNLDAAIALGSKNSEAVLKLASDVLAPISGRFSLAAEKVRKLAA